MTTLRPLWLWLLLFGCTAESLSAQDTEPGPDVPGPDVPGQPLASNVRRLLTALDSLGHPLPGEATATVSAAIRQQDSGEIQQTLDPHVLAVVTISPEERVSVVRGGDRAKIQQQGYRPAIVKVINHSTSTSRLHVSSPQAGPVYAGASDFSMRRQQQTECTRCKRNGSRPTFSFNLTCTATTATSAVIIIFMPPAVLITLIRPKV